MKVYNGQEDKESANQRNNFSQLVFAAGFE
jgi:hypothetical protein